LDIAAPEHILKIRRHKAFSVNFIVFWTFGMIFTAETSIDVEPICLVRWSPYPSSNLLPILVLPTVCACAYVCDGTIRAVAH